MQKQIHSEVWKISLPRLFIVRNWFDLTTSYVALIYSAGMFTTRCYQMNLNTIRCHQMNVNKHCGNYQYDQTEGPFFVMFSTLRSQDKRLCIFWD